MWFLASEVVPVSRPQHSDLQGEDNRGLMRLRLPQ